MKPLTTALVVILLASVCLLAAPARAATPGPCTTGVLPSGALSLICVPLAGWNGCLVVFAHGYVGFDQPLDFYHLTLPDGTNLPLLIQTFGFAFATTSYRQNGLAILEGAADIFGTNDAFSKLGGNPFDNKDRRYSGSSDDVELNQRVHRFNASKVALAALRAYETSGDLRIPLVTLHTTGDEVIPYSHELTYDDKVQLSGRGQFISIAW